MMSRETGRGQAPAVQQILNGIEKWLITNRRYPLPGLPHAALRKLRISRNTYVTLACRRCATLRAARARREHEIPTGTSRSPIQNQSRSYCGSVCGEAEHVNQLIAEYIFFNGVTRNTHMQISLRPGLSKRNNSYASFVRCFYRCSGNYANPRSR